MAVQKVQWLDEILIRGLQSGGFKGAHQVVGEMNVDSETGEVYSAKLLPPTPLSVDDVGTVLGELVTRHLIQVDEQAAQINGLQNTLASTQMELAKAQQEIDDWKEKLEQFKAGRVQLEETTSAERSQLKVEIDQLKSNLTKRGVEGLKLKTELKQLKASLAKRVLDREPEPTA